MSVYKRKGNRRVGFYEIDYDIDKVLECVDLNDRNTGILDHGELSDLRDKLQTCVDEYVDKCGSPGSSRALIVDSCLKTTNKNMSIINTPAVTIYLSGILTICSKKGSTPLTIKNKDGVDFHMKQQPGDLIILPGSFFSREGYVHGRTSIEFNIFKEPNIKWKEKTDKLMDEGKLDPKDIVIPNDYEF